MLRLTLIQDHELTPTQTLLGSLKETIMSEISRLSGRDVSDINSSKQLLISRTLEGDSAGMRALHRELVTEMFGEVEKTYQSGALPYFC
jgi:hypothetical protein